MRLFLIITVHIILVPCSLRRIKEAKLSLMSVMLMVTEVVAVLPEGIPLMSWALTTTTYWLLVSRSRVFILQLITPAERQWQRQTDREGVNREVSSDSYSSRLKTARISTPSVNWACLGRGRQCCCRITVTHLCCCRSGRQTGLGSKNTWSLR